MAYNAGKKSYTVACQIKILPPVVWGKKFLHKPNHPYSPRPPPHIKIQMVWPFDFVSMLGKRRTRENKATNQNLRYVIYDIYIKLYLLPQEIELGK